MGRGKVLQIHGHGISCKRGRWQWNCVCWKYACNKALQKQCGWPVTWKGIVVKDGC